eukprot:3871751-Amphidinium_carterae.1
MAAIAVKMANVWAGPAEDLAKELLPFVKKQRFIKYKNVEGIQYGEIERHLKMLQKLQGNLSFHPKTMQQVLASCGEER